MSILEGLTEEECYLYAIISDRSGLDLAEFTMNDAEQEDYCFRAWPFQWKWWRDDSPRQIDSACRSVGKSLSVKIRAYAFPFNYPNQEMVITAPEGVHLDAITDVVETAFMNNKLSRYMLANDRSKVKHRPFHINFNNGSRIMGRIPQHDGKAVKGVHPVVLEMDESQNYPYQGWMEIIETLKMGSDNAVWRCVAGGQLVLTQTGWKPIEDVRVGDFVFTHKNRWKPVVRVYDNGFRECFKMDGNGHPGLEVTSNHKVYARSSLRKKNVKSLMEPSWLMAGDFTNEYPCTHWASPCGITSSDPVPPFEREKGWKKVSFEPTDPTWLWLYGLYIAEGYGCEFKYGRSMHRRVHWCVNDSECDEVAEKLRSLGLKYHFYRQGDHSVKVVVANATLHKWLKENAGEGANNKRLAQWVFGLSEENRRLIFEAANYGDGSWNEDRNRWEYVTSSKHLAFSMKLLGQSLGYVSNVRYVAPRASEIVDYNGQSRTISSNGSWSVQMTKLEEMLKPSTLFMEDGLAWSPSKGLSQSVGVRHVYDLEVEDDHSYVVEGMIVSNCHGVTTGVRDHFYKFTQPDSGWKVHRIVAMMRPTWTDEERQAKIELYGSRDHPDYRRNVLGDHGDSENVLFVLSRLMANVDQNEASDYNEKIYTSIRINPERIAEHGGVLNLLDIPRTHFQYEKFWIGMDVGYINDPSEIMVFGEEMVGKKRVLRLLSRFSLERVAHQDQVEVILWVLETYKPQSFALDKTGLGLPLYQAILHETQKHPVLKRQTDKINGYGFSEKILAEIDTSIEVDPHMGDLIKDAGIHRNVLEWSTDVLRTMVDSGTIKLPYDLAVIQQFQGQTYHYSKASQDMYGRRRIFSQGTYHALDACRMAVLGWQQADLAPLLVQEKKKVTRPVFMFG